MQLKNSLKINSVKLKKKNVFGKLVFYLELAVKFLRRNHC